MALEERTEADGKRWYFEDGEKFDSVTTVLGWIYGYSHWTRRPDELALDEMSFYRERGKAVHAICCDILGNGLTPDWSTFENEFLPFIDAFDKWMHDFKPEVIKGELKVKSLLYWVAGRLDLFMGLSYPTVIDLKAGDNDAQPLVGPQTAAYRMCLRETLDHHGLGKYIAYGFERAVLMLHSDGTYRFDFCTDSTDQEDFLNAAAAFRSAKRLNAW